MNFYGQFEMPVDRFIFERYFPDANIKGIFVECGAFDGVTESSCKFFEETMGWTGYNIEPLPWIYDKLAVNRPTATNLNVALATLLHLVIEKPTQRLGKNLAKCWFPRAIRDIQ